MAKDEDRELTWGEKQAGVSFNPSGDPDVEEIKSQFADLFDGINDLRNRTENPDKKRFFSMALTTLNDAQMEAVKGITWQH